MSGRNEEEALEKAAKKFNVPKEKIKLEQGSINYVYFLPVHVKINEGG